MNTSQIESFFAETREAFHFLEQHYHYQHLEEKVKSPDEGRDTIAQSRYSGSQVGIQVWWYLAAASIGVTFFEVLQPYVFPDFSSYFLPTRLNVSKAIDLYHLAEMLGGHNDADFLLGDTSNSRKRYKRAKLIETHLHEIVARLAQATQTYAKTILEGDASIFSQVMDYYSAKQKQLYPDMLIPGLKQEKPPSS